LKLVYLSLGSNIGDRQRNLKLAVSAIEESGLRLLRASPVYETEPVENTRQAWFLNLVAEVETRLFPDQLLTRTMRIEASLGRRRTVAKGPRTIDIDILLYGSSIIHTPTLEVPHPRMAARRFVLAPLADLAPSLRHPVTGQTIAEMLAQAPPQKVERFEGGALHS
jgi:2-amino-4-hydroxy-6-hydroxymethyldihydropteridine diphosphokinase